MCASLLRAESQFPTTLCSSKHKPHCFSKPDVMSSSSSCRSPRLGSLIWSSDPLLLGEGETLWLFFNSMIKLANECCFLSVGEGQLTNWLSYCECISSVYKSKIAQCHSCSLIGLMFSVLSVSLQCPI